MTNITISNYFSRRGSRRSSPAPAQLLKQKQQSKETTAVAKEATAPPKTTAAKATVPAKEKSTPRHTSPKRPEKRSLEVPGSPGISRAGRNNSPRIDYR